MAAGITGGIVIGNKQWRAESAPLWQADVARFRNDQG
jgi:hypothetical protein